MFLTSVRVSRFVDFMSRARVILGIIRIGAGTELGLSPFSWG